MPSYPISSSPASCMTPAAANPAVVARLFFDYALSGIFQTDCHGHIVLANAAAVSITGCEAKQLCGSDMKLLFSAQSKGRLLRHWQLLLEQGISHVELQMPVAPHNELIIEMTSIQIDEIAFMHTFDDVTAQRRAQQSIENSRQTAEAANRAKSEFLANISHEIRTPLNAILGLSQLALQSNPEPQLQGYLSTILRSGRHLLTLVNDLLDSARIEAGKFEIDPQPYRLSDLLAELDDLRMVGSDTKPLIVSFSINQSLPAWIQGDCLRISQCLRNLLSNAIKFTQSGKVNLEVDCLIEKQQNWLRFNITDTGIGMTPEVLERLFLPFSQADMSTTRHFGGSGLGLYLTRELASLMGGSLTITSTPGAGTCCTLLLPLVTAPPPCRKKKRA